SRQQSEVIDAQAPTLNITIEKTTLLKGESTQIRLDFSEAVQGFTLNNLSAHNATLSDLKLNPSRHSTLPFSYVATLTPTDNVNEASNRIRVNSNWQDLNGNTPAASFSSSNYQVFTDINPTQIQSWTSNSPHGTQTAFSLGDTITLTLTFTNSVKVNNDQAHLFIDNKRFTIDKAVFDHASDKNLLHFNYTVQANDALSLSEFAVKKDQLFLTGVTDAKGYHLDLSSMPDQVALGESSLFKVADSLTVIGGNTGNTGDLKVHKFYADLNADGYMDVISTDRYASRVGYLKLYFFEGSATGINFKEGVGTPFDALNELWLKTGYLYSLTFADVDGDGDVDILVGHDRLTYLENENNIYSLNAGHSLSHISTANNASPAFADIDGDGDVDLVLGDGDRLRYFTNEQGFFTEQTGTNNPFITISKMGDIALADVDGDGDVDLVNGGRYYQNINGVWLLQTESNNPLSGLPFSTGVTRFVDVDFDGRMDVTITQKDYTTYYQNISRTVIDTQAPDSPRIHINDTSLAVGDSTTVEFHFKEKVFDFTLDDITAENASLSNLRQDTRLGTFVWTATLSPDAGVTNDSNTLSIGTDWYDAAGNQVSQITTSANYAVTSQAAATISTDLNDWVFNSPPTGQDYFSIGDTLSLTITISEAVQVNDNSAYIMLANKRFVIDKDAFDGNTDKTQLSFNYTVVEGDHLISGDLVVNSTHLTGVSNGNGVAVNDLSTALVLLTNSDAFVSKTSPAFDLIQEGEGGNVNSIKFVDLDRDGVTEFVFSVGYDDIHYYRSNSPGEGQAKTFTKIAKSASPFKEYIFGDTTSMTFADMDKDGDLDMLTNKGYFINKGGKFEKATDDNNPFAHIGLVAKGLSLHNLVDLDNDGDLDLVTTRHNTEGLIYYE
ncbi:MAG: Ig-like domain-containing protein, partial [Gammaproteobacteria bacterium]|nr:Ig-like domain-containing protein [Gammaproteobacteria bacterium]